MPGVHVPPELFVAYADEDREWVHGFLLAEVGLDRACVVTPDDFRPGAVLVEELERAVTTARCTVMVLTPAFGTSPLAALAELLASHDSLRRDSDRLVPLLLKPFELPLHLDFRVRLDCTDPARWPAETARLRELLQRGAPPPDELACPYPGLIAFGPEQAGLFFGRDRESDEISRLVRQHGFLLVVGPSGSGKSSLVSAGVLPRLRAADGDRWLVRTVRPSASVSPLASLLGESAADSGGPLADSVAALLATVPGTERLLLFVDQAEAIFVLPSKEDRDQYLDLIGQLRRTEGCTVVLALRADFYSDLMTSPLWPVSRGERVEITPLRGAALREAIVRPAAAVGAHIEPVLLERLLHDAGDEPDVLSLIQETMVLLWERRSRRLLTLSAYEDLGGDGRSGLAAALATRADAALADLLPAQQEIAQRIFVRLVQLGEGRQDTRRQQPVERAAGVRRGPRAVRPHPGSPDEPAPGHDRQPGRRPAHRRPRPRGDDRPLAHPPGLDRREPGHGDGPPPHRARRRRLAATRQRPGRPVPPSPPSRCPRRHGGPRARANPNSGPFPNRRPPPSPGRPPRLRHGDRPGPNRRRLASQDPIRDAWLKHEAAGRQPAGPRPRRHGARWSPAAGPE